MANSEGTQDIVEDVPAGKSVDKSGGAQQGDADSQQQPKQGVMSNLKIRSHCNAIKSYK